MRCRREREVGRFKRMKVRALAWSRGFFLAGFVAVGGGEFGMGGSIATEAQRHRDWAGMRGRKGIGRRGVSVDRRVARCHAYHVV